jgi:hypothetical protein
MNEELHLGLGKQLVPAEHGLQPQTGSPWMQYSSTINNTIIVNIRAMIFSTITHTAQLLTEIVTGVSSMVWLRGACEAGPHVIGAMTS